MDDGCIDLLVMVKNCWEYCKIGGVLDGPTGEMFESLIGGSRVFCTTESVANSGHGHVYWKAARMSLLKW